MEIKLKDIADFVGGKLIGDENIVIKNLAKIEEAGTGDLTFLYLPMYEKYFASTKASGIIVKPDFKKTRNDISYIEVQNPNKAFFKIVNEFFAPEFKLEGIDQTAFIHSEANRKSKIFNMKGKAYVNDVLVAEAEFMAGAVDKDKPISGV